MKPSSQPIAITFDVGGTLIEPKPSVGHIYAEIAGRHGMRGLRPEELNRRFAEAWLEVPNFDYTRDAWRRVVDETFTGLTSQPLASSFFPALYEHFALPEAWHVFADVLPALERLRLLGHRLGIISNWDERLRPLLGRLGLAPHFSAITISCEAGATKPDRRIFERAAAGLGCAPNSILHVGDSREADVAGAKAAGLAALELRRSADAAAAAEASSAAMPEFIRSLAELVAAMEGRAARS